MIYVTFGPNNLPEEGTEVRNAGYLRPGLQIKVFAHSSQILPGISWSPISTAVGLGF